MANTSTSKQPMLADRPFMRVFDLTNHLNNGFNANGNGSALVVADQINGDGMCIDDIALISRGAAFDVNLYLSTSNQVFRNGDGNNHGDAELVLRGSSAATAYVVSHLELPKLLSPVPRVGNDPKNTGLYIGRGFCLWAAVDTAAGAIIDGPNILLQGGVY